MKIKNVNVYGKAYAIARSKYPMQMGEPKDLESAESAMYTMDYAFDDDTVMSLGSCKQGSGDDNFLKGIIVQCDIEFPLYWLKQFQRYHFSDIISSQSTMHTITKHKDITLDCNEWVDIEIIDTINKYIHAYNNFDKEIERLKELAGNAGATLFEDAFNMHMVEKICIFYPNREKQFYDKKELYMKIISNLPSGFQLWMAITLNYLQAKTIYHQRKNHKLPEWHYFCKWIETLPLFKILVLGEKK